MWLFISILWPMLSGHLVNVFAPLQAGSADELLGGLIKVDLRPCRIIRLGVDLQGGPDRMQRPGEVRPERVASIGQGVYRRVLAGNAATGGREALNGTPALAQQALAILRD